MTGSMFINPLRRGGYLSEIRIVDETNKKKASKEERRKKGKARGEK